MSSSSPLTTAPHLPLQKDTRRRSILNPFLSVEAATHWQKSTAPPSSSSSNKIQSWVKKKSSSTIFLKDAGLCLSDANSSEVDQVVALAAVMRALIQPKPQGIKASELFNTRLIPTISQIATDKLYKSTLHVCTQCNEPNCSGAASARRHAAIVVLCGVVSSKEVMRLSLDWGLIVVLMRCVVDGYTQLSQCALLNASFRKKFSSLSPAVAIHPDAAHATMCHDELYRLPLLCLRALRSFTKYYFPVTVRQNDKHFSLQQSQLIKGGLLSMALEMQQSISGPSIDPCLVAKRKLQSGAYQLVKVFPDQCLIMMQTPNQNISKRTMLPTPPLINKKNNSGRKKNNRNNSSTKKIHTDRARQSPRASDNTSTTPSFFGEFSADISIAATNQLDLRAKKRMPGRPQTVLVAHTGPAELYRLSADLIPLSVAHQLSHLENLAKNSLGLSAMLSSTTSSEISRRAALSETTSTTIENADAGAEYSYLTTTSLCDTHSTNNIQGSNEELTNAQLKYAQEEAEKAAKREVELVERRRQLRKDTVAMKLRIINDVDEKKRQLERGRREAQKMRAEIAKRKRVEQQKTNAIFQAKQQQIAQWRGNLQRAEARRQHEQRNRERKEIDFKTQFRLLEKEKQFKVARLLEHEKRNLKFKYHKLVNTKKLQLESLKKKLRTDKENEKLARKKKLIQDAQQLKVLHEKFRKDKEWMREARLKRQEIEKKATRKYKSKELRWWECWDEVNECQYWEREAGIGCKENQQYSYEDPFYGLEAINIFEEYHELWYVYNARTGESTLAAEIDKKKKGFDQFAAKKKPGPPNGVYLDEVSEDMYNPTVGVTWNVPNDCGDQPLEYCLLEGSTIPHELSHFVQNNKLKKEGINQLEWETIADSLPLDVDYYSINSENFQGFTKMIAALELSILHSSAPKPEKKFVFRISFVSSVGIGTPGVTDVMDLNQEVDEDEQQNVEVEEILPVIVKSRRKRKVKKGHVDMYQFKF